MGAHYARFDCSLGSSIAKAYSHAQEAVYYHYKNAQKTSEMTSVMQDLLRPVFRIALNSCLENVLEHLEKLEKEKLLRGLKIGNWVDF